jgi:hypothetical protein
MHLRKPQMRFLSNTSLSGAGHCLLKMALRFAPEFLFQA